MKRTLAIVGGQIVAEGRAAEAVVVISDGLIEAVGPASSTAIPSNAERLDAAGILVAPGLLDIQLNGGFGHDFTEAPDRIWEVGARLPALGVTGFVPTVVTSTAAARDGMLAALASGPPAGYRGAQPIGAHFEGPFLSPQAAGAHEPTLLRSPREADPDVARWSSKAGVLMATIAPELDGALELIRDLVARGVVVSAGHSMATYEQAQAGFEAGITYATHLFNAMPALGHREPGLVGAALVDWRVTVGLIPDGIHVHPVMIRLLTAAAGSQRVSLVTDATAALGMPPGRYDLGGRAVVLDGTSVRLADDGRLAGSAITADQALRSFASSSGWTAADVVATMTSVPARLLGLADRGHVGVGSRADLTLLTADLHVVATFLGGEPVHGPWI